MFSSKIVFKEKSAKKRSFVVIMLLIPFVLIGFLELGLTVFGYGENNKLFVSTPDENSEYLGLNLNISKRYFKTIETAPTPRKDLFLKIKPENSYRIFVIGGSTAAGFPFGNNLTFPRVLNKMLSDTFPDKKIEVVNTAFTAINTYSQLDFMDEILEQKPDAVLIYSGHNEYYGALGIGSMESMGKKRAVILSVLYLQKFKTYQLVRNVLGSVVDFFSSTDNVNETEADATLMERIVANKTIPLSSDDYNYGKDQFRSNLSEIIGKAKANGVKVILSELVSNVKDMPPFESVETIGYKPAMDVYNEANANLRNGSTEDAKINYYLAKDLDALRFRAPEDFNKIINELGSEFDLPVVPMLTYFDSKSKNGIIGNELMLEHLHPNKAGYFLMAQAFYDKIKKEQLISSNWLETNELTAIDYIDNWGFTALDSVSAEIIVARLQNRWPFKKQMHSGFNFIPKNKIDSLALLVGTGYDKTLEKAHIELANYYKQHGEYEKAFDEFNALIYTVPYLDLFYEPAVQLLVKMQNYDKALELLNQLLSYQNSAFAFKWIGQIYLVNGETVKGVEYLEKARSMSPNDLTMIYNLGRAYYNTAQFEKGNEILNGLKSSFLNTSFTNELDKLSRTSVENYNSAKSMIEESQQLIKEKQFAEAFRLLKESINIYETTEANELMGMIFNSSGKNKEAVDMLERAIKLSYKVDAKLLFNICSLYLQNGQIELAENTFNSLKKTFPEYAGLAELEKKILGSRS